MPLEPDFEARLPFLWAPHIPQVSTATLPSFFASLCKTERARLITVWVFSYRDKVKPTLVEALMSFKFEFQKSMTMGGMSR